MMRHSTDGGPRTESVSPCDFLSLRIAASSAARIVLACVFVLSGISKLLSPDIAARFLQGIFQIPSQSAQVLVIALSLVETAAGFLLVLNRMVAAIAFMSSLFFLSAFTAGVFLVGSGKPCGCFGDLFPSQMDEWFVLRSLGLETLPLWKEIAQRARKIRGIALIGICLDQETPTRAYVEEEKVAFPVSVAQDEDSFVEMNKLYGVPQTIIRTSAGRVERIWKGRLSEQQFHEVVETVADSAIHQHS